MGKVRVAIRSIVFYPVTVIYLAGSAVACGIAGGWLRLDLGLVALFLLSVLMVYVGAYWELVGRQNSVNSQMVRLIAALHKAGIDIQEDDI